MEPHAAYWCSHRDCLDPMSDAALHAHYGDSICAVIRAAESEGCVVLRAMQADPVTAALAGGKHDYSLTVVYLEPMRDALTSRLDTKLGAMHTGRLASFEGERSARWQVEAVEATHFVDMLCHKSNARMAHLASPQGYKSSAWRPRALPISVSDALNARALRLHDCRLLERRAAVFSQSAAAKMVKQVPPPA